VAAVEEPVTWVLCVCAVIAVALATMVLAAFATFTVLVGLSIDLSACLQVAGRGAVGMVGIGVGGVLLVVGLLVATLPLARGRRARPVAVALMTVLVLATPVILVGAGQPSCREASYTEDGVAITFASAAILAVYAVVAAGAVRASVVLWRGPARRTAGTPSPGGPTA
jgi:hypothetical protein